MEYQALHITLLRHGHTESNGRGVYGGRSDVPLDEPGVRQAEALAGVLAGRNWTAVYASPFLRVQQTLNPILADWKGEVRVCPGLAEMDFGEWDGLSWAQVVAWTQEAGRDPGLLDAWASGNLDFAPPGGESTRSCWLRQTAALAEILKRHSSGELLIAAHQGSLRHLLAWLCGLPPEGAWHFRLPEGGGAWVEMAGETAVLRALGSAEALKR